MTTKRQVEAFCAENGIEIELSRDGDYGTHVHLYAPQGYVFECSTCHNAGAGTYKRGINWQCVWEEAQLVECDDHKEGTCEYCDGEYNPDLPPMRDFIAALGGKS